ncbi:MAG: carboxypeptidase regulatory-like domain-containing protein [Acidobacteriota bacterium]
MPSPTRAAALFACLATVSLAACGGGGSGPASPAATPAAPTDTADGPGVITGKITYDGPPPAPRPLRMDSDPKCVALPGAQSELLVVGADGGLQNVFVYVKDGLGNRTYAVPTEPVMLDQKGCQYVPHVFGVQVGQTIKVANSDAALHNVHAVPKHNREFNFSQPAGVPAVDRVFDKPELGIPLKCDVHGWMNAYANVVTHPFHAVTGADGSFAITGLPPGTYTLELWHETLGTQTQSVTVDGQTPAAVTAVFKPAA